MFNVPASGPEQHGTPKSVQTECDKIANLMAKSKRRPPVKDGWQEFLGNIRAARKQLKTDIIWYRGHTNAVTHTLVPSLLRFPNGITKERLLFERYEQAAAALKEERRLPRGVVSSQGSEHSRRILQIGPLLPHVQS